MAESRAPAFVFVLSSCMMFPQLIWTKFSMLESKGALVEQKHMPGLNLNFKASASVSEATRTH